MSDQGNYGGQCPMHYLPLPCTACATKPKDTAPATKAACPICGSETCQDCNGQPAQPATKTCPHPCTLVPGHDGPCENQAVGVHTKMSFEERARAWYHNRFSQDNYVQALTRQFAEVAEEARREALEHLAHMVPVEPYPPSVAKSGTAMRAWDQVRGGLISRDVAARITFGTGDRECTVEVLAKTCTCGSASVGSRIHSEWCDASDVR